jgi:rubrerythrin
MQRSETLGNLRELLAEMAMSVQRMLWLAQQAEIEGLPDQATLLRSKAEADSAHALAILDHLAEFDSSYAVSSATTPSSQAPVRDASDLSQVLVTAVPPMIGGLVQQISVFAVVARREGHDQVADSLEVIAGSQRRHLDNFQSASGDR